MPICPLCLLELDHGLLRGCPSCGFRVTALDFRPNKMFDMNWGRFLKAFKKEVANSVAPRLICDAIAPMLNLVMQGSWGCVFVLPHGEFDECIAQGMLAGFAALDKRVAFVCSDMVPYANECLVGVDDADVLISDVGSLLESFHGFRVGITCC